MLRRTVGDLALWTLYYPYRWWAGWAPLGWVLAVASVFGRLHYAVTAGRGRGRILPTLRMVLGEGRTEEELRTIARGYLVHKHKTLAEGFALARMEPAEILAHAAAIPGFPRLETARAGGRGAILVLYHFGNFRMLAALGHRGCPLNQFLTRTAAYTERRRALAGRVRDIKVSLDEALPARYIHYRPGGLPRAMFEALVRNEFLIIHADGSRGTTFGEMEFLGGRLSFPTGPAKLAARTGAPLVPVFVVRLPDDRHEVRIEEPIPVPSDDEEAVLEATRRCTAVLESYVLSHPEQWWTWARLNAARGPDGMIRLEARPAETEEEEFHRGAGAVPAPAPKGRRARTAGVPR